MRSATAPYAIRLAEKVHKPAKVSPNACSNVYIAHGLLGNANNWNTPASRLARDPALAASLNAVHCVDMRNHGDSPHHDNQTCAALASDLEGVILRGQQTLRRDKASALAEPEAITGRNSIFIGHSMGGLALMGMLMRRFNEPALLGASEDVQEGLDRAATSGASRFGDWPEARRVACCQSMRCVNEDIAVPATVPIRDRLFALTASPGDTPACPLIGRVSAAVIVDMTPGVRLRKKRQGGDNTQMIVDRMTQVNLSCIHNYADVEAELVRVGIAEKSMRDFVTTNIVFDGKGTSKTARWKCNLPVLARDYGAFQPSILDWYRSADKAGAKPQPCTLPVLFVFGGKSPYNEAEPRAEIPALFPNSEQVEVPDVGHFVHYENPKGFLDLVTPFLAKHMVAP